MEKQDTFRVVVLIPAYKPDDRLIQLTRELKEEKLDVLLVDDGGQKPFAPIFEKCRALGAEIAVHAVNQGKGRALKTGLNAALNIWPDLSGVVTADADGQHTLRDILRIIEACASTRTRWCSAHASSPGTCRSRAGGATGSPALCMHWPAVCMFRIRRPVCAACPHAPFPR